MGDVEANALLCVLAVACAAFAPRDERGAVLFSVALLVVNWGLYVLSWGPNSLALTLKHATGSPLTSPDLWAITDAICAVMILTASLARWWGLAMWATYLGQLAAHAVYLTGGLAFSPYSHALDTLFVVQVLIFVMIGGGNVRALCVDLYRRFRRRLFAPSASPGVARAGPPRPIGLRPECRA